MSNNLRLPADRPGHGPDVDLDRRNTPAGRTFCHKDGNAY